MMVTEPPSKGLNGRRDDHRSQNDEYQIANIVEQQEKKHQNDRPGDGAGFDRNMNFFVWAFHPVVKSGSRRETAHYWTCF